MRLFLDTANLDEIREGVRWGVLRGVTTNPTHIAKEQQDFLPLVKEICSIVEAKPVAELKEIAKSLDVKVAGMRKAQIIDAITGSANGAPGPSQQRAQAPPEERSS